MTSHSASPPHYFQAHDTGYSDRFLVRRSTLILLLIGLYVIGAHLRLSLFAGNTMILPMYLMLLSSAVLTMMFINPLLQQAGGIFTLLAGFILLQPLLSTAPGSSLFNGLLGRLQLIVSIISALALVIASAHVDPKRLRLLFSTLWGAFILLGLLELLGLKPVFDTISDALYSGSGRGVYISEGRDISIYGRIRPTAMASEPSYFADTLATLTVLIFLLDPRRGGLRSWLILASMVALDFAILPSFKIAFYVVAVLVWQLWPSTPRRVLALVAVLIASALLGLFFYTQLLSFFLTQAGQHLESGSFFGRGIVGRIVAGEVLSQYPLFGYSIGNEDAVYPTIARIWQDSGAFDLFPWYLNSSAYNLLSSGFWWQIIFLGLFGWAFFTGIVARLLTQLHVVNPMRTLICAWIIWYAGSAFVDPHTWFMVALFALPVTNRPALLSSLSPRHPAPEFLLSQDLHTHAKK